MGSRTSQICDICGKFLQPKEANRHNSKYYCEECLKKEMERLGAYNAIKDYIYFTLTNKDTDCLMLVVKQIKDYKEKYNFTDEGILNTILYLYKYEGLEFIPQGGISLVRFRYWQAQEFFEKLKSIDYFTDEEIKDILNPKSIKVTLKQSEINKGNKDWTKYLSEKKYGHMVDINALLQEEDCDLE